MRPIIAFAVLIANLASATCSAAQTFAVMPAEAYLEGRFQRFQFLVSQTDDQGDVTEDCQDLTSKATFLSSNPDVVEINQAGQVLAVADGQTTILVSVNGRSKSVPVSVSGVAATTIDFTRDVRPILTKSGCASAACHASQHGKGGLKLSVFGYDLQADFETIARASRQRRLNIANPDWSLLLRKPSLSIPHGGGRRLPAESVEYQIVRAWIAQGAPAPHDEAPQVVEITVAPGRRVTRMGCSQQLRVEARYSDDSKRDVTALARFDSMDEGTLVVDSRGLVRCVGKGQSTVMVRYEGQTTVSTFLIPYAESIDLAGWKSNNFVDEFAVAKFRQLCLSPSPLCDDATFIRRAFLDAIGTLPATEQTLAFLESSEGAKREQLVDRLLGLSGDPRHDLYNDQYAAYWTLKWSDLIRNNSSSLGQQGMWSLHNWIKASLRTNKPFDQFVRELLTAQGSIYMHGPANYFRIHNNSSALTEATAQLFLGVRLECAKCHHHPFEKYSQSDYYGLAAFFSRVGSKNSEEFGLFGRERVVIVRSSGEVTHPRTGQRMRPTPLNGKPVDNELDRRIPLAQWVTSAENEFFAKSVVNRYVGALLGRGLVEPVDDMRSTNPPSNTRLLDALAQHFLDNGFDLKQLLRVIMTSRLYQLSSQPTPANASDSRFFSHYHVKRLSAEPLLDAIDQVTAVKTKFKGMPLGTRAIELPDAEYPNYFLKTFAKPRRASVCECERSPDENLSQALHTLNGEIVAKKISHPRGRVAQMLAAGTSHEQIVRHLYLSTLCRLPSLQEQALCSNFLKESPSPKECYEDLLWALINSKHFLFVR